MSGNIAINIDDDSQIYLPWAGSSHIGGLVGEVLNGGRIRNCSNYADITVNVNSSNMPGLFAGGISGYNFGGYEHPSSNQSYIQLSKCRNIGNITTNYPASVGGITGRGAASGCYNTGSICTGIGGKAGGISGSLGLAEICDCYNTGAISGSSSIGGIAGYVNGYVTNTQTYLSPPYSSEHCEIDRCVNFADGGLYGSMKPKTGNAYEIYNLYIDGYITDSSTFGNGGTPLSPEQISDRSSYTGFNFSTVWEMAPDGSRPQLQDPREITAISMEITRMPSKTIYYLGDEIEASGEITVHCSNGNNAVISITEDMLSGYDMNTAGNQNVTVSYCGLTATYEITVKDIEPTGIVLSESNITPDAGDTYTYLTATVYPASAPDKTVTWTTSDSNVATISNGTITAVSAGTAMITAETVNGKKAICIVTVKSSVVEASAIELNKSSVSLDAGGQETLTATITPHDTTDKTVIWQSSDEQVATVANGIITAVSSGTAIITAKTSNNKTAFCVVTVIIPVSDITLNATEITLNKGCSETLTATITPDDATNKSVTWTTSDSGVAAVDQNGKVTAVSTGTATITATTSDSKSATCRVTVTLPYVSRFVWGEDNWRFNNSKSNFGNSYYMNSNYYNKLISGLNRLEIRTIQSVLENDWAGSCYGMAATSVLFKENILDPSDYKSEAIHLNEIDAPPDDDVKSLINYYVALQYTDTIQQETTKSLTRSESEKVKELLSCVQSGDPTLFTYFWPATYNPITHQMSYSGHAVVAYAVEDLSGTTEGGFEYNKKIHVYDNRLTGFADNRCVYINTNNYSWCIPYDGLSSNNGAKIGFTTNNISLINYHGYVNGNDQNSIGEFIGTLSSANVNSPIRWSSFRNTDGIFQYNSVENDDIIYYSPITDSSSIGRFNVGFKNSSIGYSMNLEEPQAQDVSMRYENCLIDITTTNSDTVSYAPDGFAHVNGSNTDYTFDVIYNEGYYSGDWYEINISGYGVDSAILRPVDDGYVLDASNLHDVKITFKNDYVSPTRTFSTDYNAVYFYEIDRNTIGIKVDTDNNGSFETELDTVQPLKNNSTISASYITLGSKITIKGSASGGSGKYTYGVYYKKSTSETWSTAQSYNANTTITFKPAAAVKYDVCVKVKDGSGTISKLYFTVSVTNELVNDSYLSAETIKKGASVTVTGKASGGTGKYTYGVYYKKSTSETWSTAQSYNANTTITFKPAAAVKYDVCVKVKDSSGSISKLYFTVTVTNELVNDSYLSAETIKKGSSVTVTGKASGGTGRYTYSVCYKKLTSETWSTAQSYSTNNTVTVTPAAAVKYDICVKVKDSSGNIAEKCYTLTVTK